MILGILTLIGALGMFLYGMNLMSTGLQKAAGSGVRNFISKMTASPFKRVLTGFSVTALIQSSSATTVMVVGFVNAGLLTLIQAIGIIMGANIGTTMTAWIIAIFGFKADVSILAVPLMALGFIFSNSKKGKNRNIGELIVGFSLLFLGLSFMKNSVPDLQAHPEVLEFIASWSGHGFWSILLFLFAGTILTLVLQSSSATVALTLIMLNMKWINFDMAAAMVLGENIGTTITANIAAAIGNTNARRAALAHTIFNLFGVIWAVALFHPFVAFVNWIVVTIGLAGSPESPLYTISMLHTCFNIINTGILIWFASLIELVVCKAIKGNLVRDEDKSLRLQYINAGHIGTAEFAIAEASKEIIHFGKIMKNGLAYINEAIQNADNLDKFAIYQEKLVKYENISDNIEVQIVNFLNKLQVDELSESSIRKEKAMYRIAGELESLGDSGEAIGRIIAAKNAHGKRYTPEHTKALLQMISLVDNAYSEMIFNLENFSNIIDIHNAEQAEERLNDLRNVLREMEYANIERSGDAYFESSSFLAIVNELERMGDFIINVSQAIIKWRTEEE